MGRAGIAMTFVTDQELKDLKSLFKVNRIDPVWHGSIPNLENISRHKGGGNGKHSFKKVPRKPASHAAQAVQRSHFIRGGEWQRPLMK